MGRLVIASPIQSKNSKLLAAVLAIPSLGILATHAHAQSTQYWDTNGVTSGAGGATPSGVWSSTATNWNSSSSGGTGTIAGWTSNNNARFGAGTDATGSYTVTVSGTINVNQIGIEEGNITFSGGTLNFTINAASGTSLLTGIAGGAANTTTTINSVMTGTKGFRVARSTVAGTQEVIFGNTSNTLTGGIFVNTGQTLKLGASEVIANANVVTLNTGGTLNLNGFDETVASLTGGGTAALGGNTLTLNSPNGETFSGVISGSGGKFVKNGTGTLQLAGTSSNTHTGLTTVNGGTLELNKTEAEAVGGGLTIGDGTGAATAKLLQADQISDSGAVTVNSGGAFDMNGIGETIGSLAGAGSIINGANLTLSGNNGSTVNFSGSYAGTGTLTKNGAGAQTLSGANSFASVNFNDGRINFNNNDAAGAGTIAVGASADEFVSTASGIVLSNAITVAGTNTLFYATSSNSLRLNGDISGAGGILRDDTGAGTLTLAGNNSFSGGVKVTSRGIVLGSGTALGTGTFTIGDAVTAPAHPIVLSSVANLTGAGALTNAVAVNQDFTVGGSSGFELAGNMSLVGAARTVTVTNTSASGTTFSGVVSGTAGFNKAGSSSLVLTNANTYSGGTEISAGTLVANNGTHGKATGSGLVTVDALSILTTTTGGTVGAVNVLAGGTITAAPSQVLVVNGDAVIAGTSSGNIRYLGNVVVTGTISPGNSPGVVTVGGDLTLSGDTEMELAGTAPGLYDQIHVGGALNFGGDLNITLIGAFAPAAGNTFDLFDFASHTGAFAHVSLPTLDPGLEWDMSDLYTTGEISVVTAGAAVPLPASAWMGLGLLGGLGAVRRFRKTRTA